MAVSPRVFVDTNIFLAATDESRPERAAAVALLEGRSEGPSSAAPPALYTSTQVFREYLVVATRPAEANGLGLDPARAMANLDQFARVVQLFPEDIKTWTRLRAILADGKVTGVRVHDANVAACALANGIGTVVTMNVSDFAGLPIGVETLAARPATCARGRGDGV
ncbi:MAG: PIN domain-containing protein [Propionibacteriaceae bacterium]|jgi:predicted nucleic acid-binding protein|nr:PIN domain-containing protein [Propionibacteriaceae bacterium]